MLDFRSIQTSPAKSSRFTTETATTRTNGELIGTSQGAPPRKLDSSSTASMMINTTTDNNKTHLSSRSSLPGATTTGKYSHHSTVGSRPCHECECCRLWKRDMDAIKYRLICLESVYYLTPEILAWFENLKLAYDDHHNNQFQGDADLVSNQTTNSTTSNLSLCCIGGDETKYAEHIDAAAAQNKLGAASKSEKSSNNNIVPEIVIENII